MSDVRLYPLNKISALSKDSDKAILVVTEGTGSESDAAEISAAIGAGSVTAASIDTALQSATAAQDNSILASLEARSSAVAHYADFGDSTAYADGSGITHMTTAPRIGTPFRLAVPPGNAAPAISHALGGLNPSNGAGLYYLSSTARARNGNFFLAFELSCTPTDAPAGLGDLGLNISFSNSEMINAGGSILPEGVVHINLNSREVESCDFYSNSGSTPLTPRKPLTGGRARWNDRGTQWPTNKRQVITFEVIGDFLRITAVGHGFVEYFHPDLSTKISDLMYWWWEPSGTAGPGVSMRRKAVLHRVTDSQERVHNEGWGQFLIQPESGIYMIDAPTTIAPDRRTQQGSDAAGVNAANPLLRLHGTAAPNASGHYVGTAAYIEGTILKNAPVAGSSPMTPVIAQRTPLTAKAASPANAVVATNFRAVPKLLNLPVGFTEVTKYAGTFGANTNTKRLQIREAGAPVFDTGDTTQNGGLWTLEITRQSITGTSEIFIFEWWSSALGTLKTTVEWNRGMTPTTFTMHVAGVAAGDVTIISQRTTYTE